MKKSIKLSGKLIEIPESKDAHWTFEKRPGSWIIAKKGDQRIRFSAVQARGKVWANIDGIPFYGEWIEKERASAGDGFAGIGSAGASDFTAQFPGKIRKILVQDGQSVEADAPLVLMEAMKMEFAIKAPTAGVVKKLLVKEGQQVQPGERLLDFDATKKGIG